MSATGATTAATPAKGAMSATGATAAATLPPGKDTDIQKLHERSVRFRLFKYLKQKCFKKHNRESQQYDVDRTSGSSVFLVCSLLLPLYVCFAGYPKISNVIMYCKKYLLYVNKKFRKKERHKIKKFFTVNLCVLKVAVSQDLAFPIWAPDKQVKMFLLKNSFWENITK